MLTKGLVQVYTGDGKGKTTAALGLALRMAGHGGRVLIYQFLKPDYLELGERKALASLENICLRYLRQPWDMQQSFDDSNAVASARMEIKNACREIEKLAAQKTYDLIVLDEIIFCLDKELADMSDLDAVIKNRDPHVEIVLTGRGAGAQLIAAADLVTQFIALKHPIDKGICARKGIEF